MKEMLNLYRIGEVLDNESEYEYEPEVLGYAAQKFVMPGQAY